MNKIKSIYFKSLHSPINFVILLGETVKAALSLWLVVLSPFSSILIPFYLLIQWISSPLQGGKSDNICRKSALLVTIFATGISQILFFFALLLPYGSILNTFLLIAGLCIQGRWANIPAISRAALSDAEDHSHLNFTIPLSFSILSFPWLFMFRSFPKDVDNIYSLVNHPTLIFFIKIAPLFIFLYSIIAYIYTKRRFYDTRDKDLIYKNQIAEPKILTIIHSRGVKRIWLHAKYEPFFIYFELKKTVEILRKSAWGWVGGILYEYGFHSIFYYLDESGLFIKEDFLSQSSLFTYYIAGALVRPIFLSSNRLGIILGILLSILSVLAYNFSLNPAISQGIIGLGSGLFLSCFYLHFLTNQKIHSRGKIVGAADSMQTLGELLATLTYLILSVGLLKFIPNIINTEVKYFTLFLFVFALYCFRRSFSKERKSQ